MKSFFRNIHLYLSLAAGIVIAIVCLTGAILVFEKEMQHSIYPERYRVVRGTERVPLTALAETVKQQVPDAKILSARIYSDPTRTVEISYTEKEPDEAGKENGGRKTVAENEKKPQESKKAGGAEAAKGGKKGGKGNNTQAFMNPYTGELISLYKHRNSFFFTVFRMHRWLLNEDTGKLIVGVSTVFFLFILLTGIILWWPKNQQILKQRLKLKWSGGWKRLSHDLHIVVGFYTAIFLFAFAFTGLAWSFKWFHDAIYTVTGTENKQFEPPVSTAMPGAQPVSMDTVFENVRKYAPTAEYYVINLPKEPEETFAVTFLPQDAPHEKATNQLFFDQYTGNFAGRQLYAEKNLGQRVRSTFYPVHMGSIAGMPGRIIAFISCIAGFTFPITGTILWLRRLKKNKKSKRAKRKVRVP